MGNIDDFQYYFVICPLGGAQLKCAHHKTLRNQD